MARLPGVVSEVDAHALVGRSVNGKAVTTARTASRSMPWGVITMAFAVLLDVLYRPRPWGVLAVSGLGLVDAHDTRIRAVEARRR